MKEIAGEQHPRSGVAMSLQAPGHLSRIAGYSRGVANPVVDVLASHLLALVHRPPTECRIPFGKRVASGLGSLTAF